MDSVRLVFHRGIINIPMSVHNAVALISFDLCALAFVCATLTVS